jgi:hypothetical protein
MKKNLIIVLLLIFTAQGFAVYSQRHHDKGLLYLRISNYGRFGYQDQGIWPKGSGESYIYGAGFWVGGLNKCYSDTTSLIAGCDPNTTEIFVNTTSGFDSTGVIIIEDELLLHRGKTDTSFIDLIRGFAKTSASAHIVGTKVMKMGVKVSIGYDASSAQTEFVPGDLPNEPGYPNPDERVLMSDDPADTSLWPLRDSLGNSIIRSKQDSYAILNDQDSAQCSPPLLIKVIQVGYAWDYHYYEDFIFLNYLVVNDSPDTIFHTHLALNCDADIGIYTDDLIGFDESRDLGYAYDSDFYEPGWIHTPGFIGFDFLESPPDTQNQHTITEPTDVRFLQCTGPFDFAPGETVKVVIAVIAGADTNDFLDNDNLAQNLYNSNYLTHDITVQSPNGGEEILGNHTITWVDSSATGAPLLVDISCSRDGGATYQDIATSIPDEHYYDWNTVGFPDGTRYIMRVTVHDTLAVGEDVSDSLFTINNPGNGVPDVILLSPLSGTLQDTVMIEWWANDADHDTLLIDLYAKREGGMWQTIAESLVNTGAYDWNTFYFHNGDYRLKVIARDNDTCGIDSSLTLVTITNDHTPAAIVEHVQGGCNALTLSCLLYNPEQLTGHTYETRFYPIEEGSGLIDVYYCYDLWDMTTNTCLVEHCSLGVYLDGRLCHYYSPIIDGFALEFNIQVDKESFRFIEFSIVHNQSGFDGILEFWGEDSMGTAPPINGNEWPFRGSDYIIRWKKYQPDTTKLTLEICDTTNLTYISYDSQRNDSWRFEPGSPTEIFNPSLHKWFYLCGGCFCFNLSGMMTIPPDVGDIWQTFSSGHRVPCNENIYSFTTTGIIENSNTAAGLQFSVLPSVFKGKSSINFTLMKESPVTISIYNILGQRVALPLNRICQPGSYNIDWTADDLPSGVYFVRIVTQQIDEVKKTVYLR